MTATRLWLLVAALGVIVLPWHLPQDGGLQLLGLGVSERDAGSALWQALVYGRFWFWPVIAALALASTGALIPGARGGRWLVIGGAFGLLALAAQGFAVGLQGWSLASVERLFGPLGDRQFGIGLGAAATATGFLFTLTTGLARRGAFNGDRFLAGAVGAIFALITVFTLWPVLSILAQMFTPRGQLTLTASFAARVIDARIWGLGCFGGGTSCGVLWNTLMLAIATATATTALGLAFALVVLRTGFPAQRALRFLTVLPIITPPFVIGLGLILIFGRSGLINQLVEAVSGIQLGRWIYGGGGVWLAQVFSFTPTAFLVLIGVVEGISPTLEEASQTLRGSRMRTFGAVTLPLMLPGLANAWLVCFVESLADFGNPIVLGGSYGVLSTEIFFAVVGAQQDFGRAAVLASLLLGLAVMAFLIQRAVIGRRSYVSLAGKGDAGVPAKLPRGIAALAYAVALPWAVLTIVVYTLALGGGFVRVWGRDWSFTLQHFHTAFAVEIARDGSLLFAGQAWQSLGTTLMLAGIAAPLTAALGLLAAWVLSRQRFAGRTILEFTIMLTFAVPGTVLGVAYILTYNVPPLEITGTAFILIACFVFRNLPVGLRSGLAAMSQIDKSLDEAAIMLRASTQRTLATVVLPLIKPAIMTALIYAFVRSMTTVSAVIFLVSAQYEMATVFIVNRVVAGDYGVAIAYCSVLIALTVVIIALVQLVVGERRIGRRARAAASAPAAPVS